MRFPYATHVDKDPEIGEFILLRRPELPNTLIGPGGESIAIGLVDTGSDHTIIPARVSAILGIDLSGAPVVTSGVAYGGQRLALKASEVTLRLEATGDSIEWRTEVLFYDFPNTFAETLLLGHSAFLDYFIAIFDGESCELELQPTSELLEICLPQDQSR